MSVTPDELQYIAALARLRLRPEEIAPLTQQLNSILAHVDVLAGAPVGTAGGDPPSLVVDWHAALRGDTTGADELHRPPQVIAPAWEDGFFSVPRLPAMDAGGEEPEGVA